MKLSIITACYNAENSIGRTITSVLNQKDPVFEYYIIDGGSSDKTISIAKEFEEKFKSKGINYHLVSEKDDGTYDAMNKGIMLAHGDVIGLINSDDELLANTSEILKANYDSKVDVYYGNCVWIDEGHKLQYISKPKVTKVEDLYKLKYNMVLIHPATFIAKKAYAANGLYDKSFFYSADQELLYRFYKNQALFKYIDKPLSIFKAGGVSDRDTKEVIKETSRILEREKIPRAIIKGNEILKLVRNKLSKLLKQIGVYKILKEKNKNA